MRIHRLIRLTVLMIGTIMPVGALCAQSVPMAAMPGPITPPTLLPGDDKVLPQCKGIAAAEVKLDFVVNTEGVPTEVHVQQSPSDKHTACALEMISNSKYLPAMRDGKPVAVKLVLTISVAEKM